MLSYILKIQDILDNFSILLLRLSNLHQTGMARFTHNTSHENSLYL